MVRKQAREIKLMRKNRYSSPNSFLQLRNVFFFLQNKLAPGSPFVLLKR